MILPIALSLSSLLVIAMAFALWRYRRRHVLATWTEDGDEAGYAGVASGLVERDIAVSLVVVSRGAAAALERHIEGIAEQRGVEYEVIVVDADGDGDYNVRTSDAMKRVKMRFPNVRCTFVPPTASGVDIDEVAMMLGARAASHRWVVYVSPQFEVPSELWLLDLMQYVDDTLQLLVDYGREGGVDNIEAYSWWQWRRKVKAMKRAAKRPSLDASEGPFIVRRDWYLERYTAAVTGEGMFLLTDPATLRRKVLRVRVV